MAADITERPSPNFGPRRDGLRPELVVLHYTAMASAEAALGVLCDPTREVSAHYLIDEGGRITRLVAEDMRAWHAGAGTWAGRGDVNSRSIGIELANDGKAPFAAPQMAALECVLGGILARWSINPAGVIGHSDMAPTRKRDPGARFDWRRLALRGLSVWPLAGRCDDPVDKAQWAADAARFGYPEMAADERLATVRLRFRPWARGPLDGYDCALMAELAARWPAGRQA